MSTPLQINHHCIFTDFQSKSPHAASQAVTPDFINLLCSIFGDIRSFRHQYKLVDTITAVIWIFQVIFISLCANCSELWLTNPQYNYLSYLFSSLYRIIPYDSDLISHYYVSLAIFIIHIILILHLFLIYYTYKPANIYTASSPRWSPALTICAYRGLLFPSSAFFFYAIFQTRSNKGQIILILSIISVLLSFVGFYFCEILRKSYPSFSVLIDEQYIPFSSIPYMFYTTILSGLIECAPHIKLLSGRFADLLIAGLLSLSFGIAVFILVPFVSFQSNLNFILMFFYSFFSIFFAAFGFKYQWNVGFLFSIQIFAIPVIYLILKLVLTFRINSLLKICDDCFDNQKFAPLKIRGVAMALNMAGLSFRKDWSIFEYLIESYPANYNVYCLYAKYVILFPDECDRLKEIIRRMYQTCRLTLLQSVSATFFEAIYIQSGPMLNFEVANAACCSVVDDYILSLHLFWTEILLGRSDRLVSLSNSVNQKYNTARAYFDQLGLSSLNLDHYQRFRSISTLQFTKLHTYQNNGIIQNIVADSAKVVPFVDTKEFPPSLSDSDRLSMRSLTVEQVAIEMRQKLVLARHFIIYSPFYAALIIIVLIGCFHFQAFYEMKQFWVFQKSVVKTMYPLITPFMIEPIIALQFLKIVPKEVFKNSIINNDWFPSFLQEPQKDSRYLFDVGLENLKEMNRLSQTRDIVNMAGFMHSSYSMSFFIPFANKTKDMMFSSYLSSYAHLTNYRLDGMNSSEYINTVFSKNLSKSVSDDFYYMAKSLVSFLEVYPSYVENYWLVKLTKKTTVYELIVAALIIIELIIQISFLVYVRHIFRNFFQTMFVLPKITISQLIDKLGSRISAKFSAKDDIDSNLKYNLTQLSYQEAPQSFVTSTQSSAIILVVFIFVAIILRLLFTPCTYIAKEYINEVNLNLRTSSPELRIPFYVVLIARKALELLYLQNMPKPEDNYFEQLIEKHLILTKELYNTFLIYVIDIAYKPPIQSDAVFLSTGGCDQTVKLPTACRALTGASLFFASEMIQFNNMIRRNQTFDPQTVNAIIGSIFGIFCRFMPTIPLDLYDSYEEHFLLFESKTTYLFLGYILAVAIMFELAREILRKFLSDPDFTLSFLTSIPAQVLANFSMIAKRSQSSETGESSGEMIMGLFEDGNVIQYIVEMIMFCDDSNTIVLTTPSAQSKLLVEEGMNFREFLDRLSGFSQKIELPPQKQEIIHIDVRDNELPSMFLKTTITPLKKTEINGRQIAYASTMVDVSQRENLISQLNMEANKVRLLMTQFVPWKIAERLLNGGDVQPLILPKIISTCFMLKCRSPLLQTDILILQNALRDLMRQNPFLSFFGRNLQMFRIISGFANPAMPMTDQGVQTIHFAINLIEIVKEVSLEIGKNIDVHCGMHTSGPFYADILESSPPVYDVFGFSMTICEMVALKCLPNRVNVTRDVYELIFKQGFIITFESEIEVINGSVLPIHMVQRQQDT